MKTKRVKKPYNDDWTHYWKYPEEGFPRMIWWKVVAGDFKLTPIMDHDIVFDNYDLKIRRLI